MNLSRLKLLPKKHSPNLLPRNAWTMVIKQVMAWDFPLEHQLIIHQNTTTQVAAWDPPVFYASIQKKELLSVF